MPASAAGATFESAVFKIKRKEGVSPLFTSLSCIPPSCEHDHPHPFQLYQG
jgi:hypothetical protein